VTFNPPYILSLYVSWPPTIVGFGVFTVALTTSHWGPTATNGAERTEALLAGPTLTIARAGQYLRPPRVAKEFPFLRSGNAGMSGQFHRERVAYSMGAGANKPHEQDQPGPVDQTQKWGGIVLSGVLLTLLAWLLLFGPEHQSSWKSQLTGFLVSVFCGAIGYLISGTLSLTANPSIGKFGAFGIKATGGAAFFIVALFVWHQFYRPEDSKYLIFVHVIKDDGSWVQDATLETSVHSRISQVGSLFEVQIASVDRPDSGHVHLHAENRRDFLIGDVDIELGKLDRLGINIPFKRIRSARALGYVVDNNTKQPIQGALVSLAGHPEEGVMTGPKGEFNLAANAAPHEYIRLHVEKEGYSPEEVAYMAGDISAQSPIILVKRKGHDRI
jgi:hypothetical protein